MYFTLAHAGDDTGDALVYGAVPNQGAESCATPLP